MRNRIISSLSVSAERKRVAALPAGSPGSSNALVGAVALLVHATSMTTRRGQTTALTVLVDRRHDPVDGGIVADGRVVGIHQDHLVVLVGSVLVHPVAVQHTQVRAHTAHTALGNRLKIAGVLQLVNTLVLGLSVHNSLRIRSLASSTANSHTVHDVTLLGLHTQLAGLVGTSGVRHIRST